MDKLIITAAITGSHITRQQTPYIPITPEEIVASSEACWRAGAAIVHLHVRDPSTGQGTQDLELFRRVVEPLRARTDLILCLTTSGIPGRNLPTDERLVVLELRPDLASLDAGTLNLGGRVFANTPDFLDEAAERMIVQGVKPELEVFDSGMAVACLRMRAEGKLNDPLHVQFVLGTPWGAPATAKALVHLTDFLTEDATWSVAGVGRHQLSMGTLALVMGGHIRVGLEDSIYYQRGELATSNAQLVERVVCMAEVFGRSVADPSEAREMLGLTEPGHQRESA